MKKLLTILAAIGLTATAGAGVVACKTDAKNETKVDLSTNADVKNITVTNDSTERTVLLDLQGIKGLEKLDAEEVTITIVASSETVEGSVTIKATDKAVLVSGETKLVIAKIGEEVVEKIDLSTNADVKKIAVTNDSTEATVLLSLQGIQGLEKIALKTDVTIAFKKATTDAAGSVVITAVTDSTLVYGTANLEIPKLSA